MPQNDGKGSLGVFAGEGIGIGVADTGVVDFNADFVGFWGCYFDVFDAEILTCFPCYCCLLPSISIPSLSHLQRKH